LADRLRWRTLDRADLNGAEDQVAEGGDEDRRIADGGHHAEALDASFFGVGAPFDIYFMKGFDVLGDERDRDDKHFLDAFVAEAFEGSDERGFEPLGGADFALVAEEMDFGPVGKLLRALLANETNGFFHVARIGIALFDQTEGEAMGAENQMDAGGIGKLTKDFADVGDECLDVKRMIVEVLDGAFGEGVDGLAVNTTPLFETAERGGIGIVRIKRKKDEFVETPLLFDFGCGVLSEGLPVAHGGDGDGIDVRFKRFYKTDALAFGENANGRAAANLSVALGDRDAAFFGDKTGERAANEIDRAEGDDVRVEKEIAEKGLDGAEGIGAAELEEDDADAFSIASAHR